jgi:hypothetical protein
MASFVENKHLRGRLVLPHGKRGTTDHRGEDVSIRQMQTSDAECI